MQTAFQPEPESRYYLELSAAKAAPAPSAVAVDEVDRVLDGSDFFSRIVRDFDVKFFFERHYQLDNIKAVCAQIVDETCTFSYLVSFNAEMLDDDFLDPFRGIAHFFAPYRLGG
jgi:hypothetical protein